MTATDHKLSVVAHGHQDNPFEAPQLIEGPVS